MIRAQGNFTATQIAQGTGHHTKKTRPVPKYMIKPHVPFEIVELPNGKYAKFAYGSLYDVDLHDLSIELKQIAFQEKGLEGTNHVGQTIDRLKECKKILKHHYKRCVAIIDPEVAAGWNRWSDNILEMFLSEKLHKVLWGSGNCGKSSMMGVLLYIKWRVNPSERMIVIASRVMKDAKARVFGYIKEIHAKAPPDAKHPFKSDDGKDDKGIYTLIFNKTENKWVINERGCIVSLPIKVDAKRMEIGSNLLGKHPKDRLVLAFDEGQEIPGTIQSDKIFINWYTNKRLDVYIWGNPIPVEYHAPDSWDLLFKLGSDKLSIKSLRAKEKEANKTTTWSWNDTFVLHLSMMDSPKDDPDEKFYLIQRENGNKDQRLFFLAGQENVEQISQKTSPQSASWYSQVLGFPFIDTSSTKHEAVLSGYIISKTKDYPLIWRTPTAQRLWFMAVDPSVTGKRDPASIVCGEIGTMVDGRMGIDIHNGRYCKQLRAVEGQDFSDTIVENMYDLSKTLNIHLKQIAAETHSSGEVLRYAINAHIEKGKWAEDKNMGQNIHIVDPTAAVTDRLLFKSLGHMQSAKDMCADAATEYWTAVRCAVQTRQIFNIPEHILGQFYNRYLGRSGNGMKYKLETKKEMGKRGIESPNDADALAILVEIIRRNGFSYKYTDRHGYKQVYGEDYDAEQAFKKLGVRLGTVSSMLGLNQNLGEFVGAKKKVKKSKGFFTIDSI